MQAKDHTAGNLCRKGTILWLLSCWPLYVVKLLNKHSPWLTPRVGEAQCFGRRGLTETGASKELAKNRNKERKKIQVEEEMHVGHHSHAVGKGGLGNRMGRFTWRCILLWFGMGCDCHAHMDPMHPTAVAAGGQ